ncbi:hypothetical protein BGX29_006812 [Mortierella sp. GBA35]|nr:hypothetical protein BGX29_006812 [Mortierella sp. GBA35]
MSSSNKRSTSAEWSNGGEGSSGKTKRVRFGGDRPNTTALQEVDDSDLLEQRKARRGAVTVVEYKDGEESSDDEEDVKKKKLPIDDDEILPGAGVGGEEDEEEDMFADPEEVAKKEEERKKKAAAAAMKGKGRSKGFDRSEIEGEDLNLADLDEDDYDSDGNLKIEAFNMKEELEEGGDIDESGNFVRKLDPERFHDSWLEGLSRKEIESARRAHERKERQAQADEREAAMSAMTQTDIYLELVNILRPSESVVEALQRLGGGAKKGGAKGAKANKKKTWQKNKSTTATAMDTESTAEPAESEDDIKRRRTIEKLTDLCDKMMAMGHFDVYEETYEQMVRNLRRADVIPDDWEVGTPVLKPGEHLEAMLDDDPLLSSTAQWEYKWASPQEGQDADQVFGPFSSADMKSWSEQGFFSNGILVRMAGDTTFEPATDSTFE